MAETNCTQIQDRISEYLNDELIESERQSVESHLMHCKDCEKELKMQQKLQATFQQQTTAEMPEAFWQAFPEQVLAEYKTQKASTANNAKPDTTTLRSLIDNWFSKRLTITGTAVLASGLLLVVGLSLLYKPQNELTSPSRNWASTVSQTQQLAQMVKQHSVSKQQLNQFAFAARNGQPNFFTSAAVYVEAISLIVGKDHAAAKQHLEYLRISVATVINQKQRLLLYSLISKLTVGTSATVLLDQLVDLEHGLRNTALQLGQQNAVLWDSGLLISRLKLAALLKDKTTIKQLDQFDSLKQQLLSNQAPPGAIDALNKIQTILRQGILTEKELNILTEQTTRIQLIIG